MSDTLMTPAEARKLRADHDSDLRALSRQTKAQLQAIRYNRGVIHVYGKLSKEELINALLDDRYPHAKLNESIHVLYHVDGLTNSVCEWCK